MCTSEYSNLLDNYRESRYIIEPNSLITQVTKIHQLNDGVPRSYTPSTSSTPPKLRFAFFPLLPPEIRATVWRYAISFPRLVEVHPVLLKLFIEPRDQTMENHNLIVAHYRSLTPDPALLSTSREPRYYALKMYKRTVLATEYLPDSVYFEYEPDTMYLGASIMDRFTRSSEFMWDPHPAIFQGGERYITVDEMRNDNPLDLIPGKPGWDTLRSLRSLALDAKWVLRPLGNYRGMGVHVCRASVREVCRGMTSLWKTCMEWRGLREVVFVLHVQDGARRREDGELPLEILRDEVREHMERHVQFVNSYSYDGADHLREHIGACGRNYSEIPDGAILWLDGKEKRCPDVRVLYQLARSNESGDGCLERSGRNFSALQLRLVSAKTVIGSYH